MSNEAEGIPETTEKIKKKKKVVKKVVVEEIEEDDGDLEVNQEVSEGKDDAAKVSKKKLVKDDGETTTTTTTVKKKVKRTSVIGEDGVETKAKRRVSKSKQFVVDEGGDDPLEITKTFAEQDAGEIKIKKIKKSSKSKQIEGGEEGDVSKESEDVGNDGVGMKKSVTKTIVKSGEGGVEETTITTTTTTSEGDGGVGEVVKTTKILGEGEIDDGGDLAVSGVKVKKVKKVKKTVVVEEEEEEDGNAGKIVMESTEGADANIGKIEAKVNEKVKSESAEVIAEDISENKSEKNGIKLEEIEEKLHENVEVETSEKKGGDGGVETTIKKSMETAKKDELIVDEKEKSSVEITKEEIKVEETKPDNKQEEDIKEQKTEQVKVAEEKTEDVSGVGEAENPLEKSQSVVADEVVTVETSVEDNVEAKKEIVKKIGSDVKDLDDVEVSKTTNEDSAKAQVTEEPKVEDKVEKDNLKMEESIDSDKKKVIPKKYELEEDNNALYKTKKPDTSDANLDSDILGKINKNKDFKSRLEALENDFEALPTSVEKKNYDFGQNGDLASDKYDNLIENSKKLLKGYENDPLKNRAYDVDDFSKSYKTNGDYGLNTKRSYKYDTDIHTDASKKAGDPYSTLYTPKVQSSRALIGNQLRLRDDLRNIRQEYGGLGGDIDHIIDEIKYRNNKPHYYNNSLQGGISSADLASHAATLSRKYAPTGSSITGYTPFSAPFVTTGKSHLSTHEPHHLSSFVTNHYHKDLGHSSLSGVGGAGGVGGGSYKHTSHTDHTSSGHDSKYHPSYSTLSYGKPYSPSSSLTSKYGTNPYTYKSSKSPVDSYSTGKSSFKRYNRGTKGTPSTSKTRFKATFEI